MRALRPYLFLLAISATTCAVAQEFTASVPLECKVLSGYDCLPGQASCGKIKPELDIEPVFTFNIPNKEVKSPYRTAMLKISNSTTNRDSLVVQGVDTAIAWSALIKKATGAMTVSVADAKGGYIAFGQCKMLPAAK